MNGLLPLESRSRVLVLYAIVLLDVKGALGMNLMPKILLKWGEIWYTCSPILQCKSDSRDHYCPSTGPGSGTILKATHRCMMPTWFPMYLVELTNFLAMKVYSFIAFLCL